MAGKNIATTTIVKDKGGYWRVKAFDIYGNYLSRLDYFTDDRTDAEQTAARMVGEHAGSVLNALCDSGWTPADGLQTATDDKRLNVWRAYNCWSNYPASSICGRDILDLWNKLQPYLTAVTENCPAIRPSIVRTFVEAADVLAFG